MSGFERDVVIGLEVHLQLDTLSKLFCSCATKGEDIPNSRTCPVCLGHPGARPVVNKKVVEWGMKIALALGCSVNPSLRFSRKTYFYPDLAKNYQITQFEVPLGENGSVVLDDGTAVKIRRVHIEEDPASLVHKESYSLIDYNRSGIPLVEIVTEPDLASPAHAREFMKKLLGVVSYLHVFDAGSGVVKADANISIRERGYERVEIKNVTGFKEIERALSYELERQRSQEVVRETRGWDSVKGLTFSMRLKEEEADYGYILDPDFPSIPLSEEWVESVKKSIPELGHERAARWVSELGIDKVDAGVIAGDLGLAGLFESVVEKVGEPALVSRWFRREVLRVLNLHEKSVADLKEESLVELFDLLKSKKVTDRIGQELIEEIVLEGISPKKAVSERGLEAIGNDAQIRAWCHEAIKESPDAVKDYKNGVEKAFNSVFGKVMKKAKGKALPEMIRNILKEELG